MDSYDCFGYCFNISAIICNDYVQSLLDAPMPWIGMYIAAASAACSLAMAADAFNGFRRKKLWFPCKYFSLNAFSLTVLAVAMKLPVDLTSNMKGFNDQLARISSLALMSTAMSNFMTSLGSMENNEIVLNVAALCILVFTISGNVFIQISKIGSYYFVGSILAEEVGSIVVMLILLVTSCSFSLMIPSAKRYIEAKHCEIHKSVSWGTLTVDELRAVVKRYWVMAATGSPQFVMARSAISSTSGLMCLLMALTLVEAHVRVRLFYNHVFPRQGSMYKWSVEWILYVQSIGVVLGTIAPLFRWYIAASFRISGISRKSMRDEWKIETYWVSKLVEWRESSLPLQIRHYKCRKLLHGAKRSVLKMCIGVQILLVLTSKLLLFFSAKFGSAVFLCFHHIVAPNGSRSGVGTEHDISDYVLLLEDETNLPKEIVKNICDEMENLIETGEKKKPKYLTKLLEKCRNFDGVREFDSNEVPSLHSQEPPNCWSMPVVTLTSIAIALPNVTTGKASQLLRGVTEGLSLVKLIEKTLDKNGELESIRSIADVVWVRVELYRRWLDTDLQAANLTGGSYKDTLQNLSSIAKKIVNDFAIESGDFLMQNPLNWPFNVIAASSMYWIAQTILLAYKDVEHQTDDELFERLSIIISDILAACLTNLVRVITIKCHENDIIKRQKSVGEAAVLLGECEKILGILQKLEIPSLAPEKAANIDDWRAFTEQGSDNRVVTASSNHVC